MRKGFTLVELSIVLVIVGLLIGGVLKGKAMIEGTKIKKVKTDIDGITAAVYTYQDRFNALPGDINIDGLITTGAEAVAAWQALISTGLISGDSTQATEALLAKKNPFGSIYSFAADANSTYITTTLTAEVATELDLKYDDNLPATGDVRIIGGTTLNWYAF